GFGYLALLLLSAALNYFIALFIRQESKPKNAKFFTTCAVITNILMLAVFKYTDFFISNTNTLFSLTIPLTNIALPIGISFYTFKAISYIVDVYWEKVDPQKNYFNFLLYISMFPTIVAGPIIRYDSVENELTSRRTSFNDINDGIGRIIVGLAKKVIISNSLAAATSNFFTTTVSSASVLSVWMGAACFALQMYFDFSGYSDIAVGLGRLFGFNIMENFNYPFISKTVSEFWQRWHISLGTFFKDYLLYLPIFGKRRKYFSLFLVWFCTGFWHGASWNFIIWGLYFGVFMLFETLLGKKRI
ncbi:MAG: MBOAT family O-acyltransferase, partial [Clostridia bacterium]